MCTSIAMTTGSFYFGRNMDLQYEFDQEIVIAPRSYPFSFRMEGEMPEHYAMIGMATVQNGYPLYAEASNEKGLCIAGLNFPDNAYYSPKPDPDKANISPFELIPWILGRCTTVPEARQLLENTHLVAIPFDRNTPLATLHWHIADKNSSIVLESTRDGLQIYDDPVGIMTNNPPFSFHLQNLCQYMNLTPSDPCNCFSNQLGLKPFGFGLGSIGLPGDFSPASRFVKCAYLLLNSRCDPDEDNSVAQFFHLLESVSMVRGGVRLSDGRYELTLYSCCINAEKSIYYYTTYTNHQITAIDLFRENLNADALVCYPFRRQQRLAWEN